MIELALATGIAPSVWADEDERAVVTAWDLIDEARDALKDARGG